ncbi:MAG TPA: hypothetical protein VF510_20410 [Ktedonobacterales bacterium]
MEMSETRGLLLLAGTMSEEEGVNPEVFRSEPPASYNRDEQRLSILVQRELDRMIMGGCNQLVLLKLYPQQDDVPTETLPGTHQGQHLRANEPATAGPALQAVWPTVDARAVRQATVMQIAADAISFFGPLHGGVLTQVAYPDVIVQGRRFTTAYPHINLERYNVYDVQTNEPVLGAWRARRIQNQRRETRTNRMIDIALLVLEVSQAIFPRLLR